jgi:anti-anti-sigma factor
MNTADQIAIEQHELAGCTVAGLGGRLDAQTYGTLRDRLIKLAIEQPRALLVQADGLEVSSTSALTVFSAVWMRINQWPAVPMALVAVDERQRRLIRYSGVQRYVPTYSSLTDALGAVEEPPQRRRHTAVFPAVAASSHAARAFVRDTCVAWNVVSRLEDALGVASELVENAITHGGTDLELRLELRAGHLTVAVRDGNPRPAVLRQGAQGGLSGYGLQVIAALSKAWGCSPAPHGGKVVWAVLSLVPNRLATFTV